jgi:hypothetical protein
MTNNKEFTKDWVKLFFAPLVFGGYLILIIYLMLCDYLSIDIEMGGIILIPIWISYYLMWKIIFKGGEQ